jgi:primase-polymerase (primpol)-like protein
MKSTKWYRGYNTFQNTTAHCSESQLRRLEKWDKDQGGAMRNAEKLLTHTCQKYYCRQHSATPALFVDTGISVYTGIRRNRDMSTSIFRLQNKIRQHNPDFMFPMQYAILSEAAIIDHWKEAHTSLKQCQVNARELAIRVTKTSWLNTPLKEAPNRSDANT